MKTLYVKDLQKNQIIDNEIFIIIDCEKNEDKNGKTYCNLIIGDKTGKIPAKIWSEKLAAIDAKLLQKEVVVSVVGRVEDYKGKLQVNIFEMSEVNETALDDFIESSEYNPDEMMETLMKEIKEIKNKEVKAILTKILNDDEINRRFKFWPAASTVHHDFRSGLLQHVLEMLEIAKSMRTFYPDANFDILKAGIVLHDIGKLYELDGGSISVSYTKEGTLVGHIVKGVLLFEQFGGRDLDEDIYLHIVHLILSHHGSLEYGSPVLPSTVEAIMLTYIDNLSAKSRTAMKAKKSILEGELFSPNNYWLAGVKVWKGGDLTMSEDIEDNPGDPQLPLK